MLFEPVFAALNEAGVRFVVVGGLATVLHGYARLTADVDIVIDLAPEPCLAAIDALTKIGLRPRAPVDARAFADPAQRRAWIEEKGMRVFSVHDAARPMLEVDLFAEPPLDFEELWSRSEPVELGQSTIRIAAIADLIAMKRLAGRPEDLSDIEALEEILKTRAALRG